MLKKSSVRGLIGFCGVALMTATAGARVYNGGICEKLGTGGTLVRSSGTIYNDSTSSALALSCPVIRENPSANIAAGQISFDVFDRTSVAEVGCAFINEIGTTSGLGAAEVDSVTSAGNAAGVQNLPTTTQSTSLGSTQFSHIYCTLPAKVSGSNPSHIARIWTNEP